MHVLLCGHLVSIEDQSHFLHNEKQDSYHPSFLFLIVLSLPTMCKPHNIFIEIITCDDTMHQIQKYQIQNIKYTKYTKLIYLIPKKNFNQTHNSSVLPLPSFSTVAGTINHVEAAIQSCSRLRKKLSILERSLIHTSGFCAETLIFSHLSKSVESSPL